MPVVPKPTDEELREIAGDPATLHGRLAYALGCAVRDGKATILSQVTVIRNHADGQCFRVTTPHPRDLDSPHHVEVMSAAKAVSLRN